MMTKEDMDRLVYEISNHPNRLDVAAHTSHHFAEGLYIREMYLPKGTVLVGKEHLIENFFYLAAGRLTVWDGRTEVEIEAPWMGIVPKGAKRVGYAHDDVICFNTIPNADNCTDIPTLEARYFVDDTNYASFQSAAIVAGVVAVGAGIMSGIAGAKSSKATRKGSKERRKADLMTQFLKRREMLQQYRMAQAASLSGAVASGADIESSGYQGVRTSLQAQVEYNTRSENQILGRESAAFKYDMQASKYAEQASLWGTVSSVASMFGGMIGPKAPGAGAGAPARSSYGPSPIGDLSGGVSIAPQTPSLLGGGPPASFANVDVSPFKK